jgi:hypothetical protein
MIVFDSFLVQLIAISIPYFDPLFAVYSISHHRSSPYLQTIWLKRQINQPFLQKGRFHSPDGQMRRHRRIEEKERREMGKKWQ